MPDTDSPTADRPRLILDTNVVLDWLVFGQATCVALAEAIISGHVVWMASASMHEELAHVLGRGSLNAWQPDLRAIDAARRRWAVEAQPTDLPSPARLRCSDPDDQKFIDLARQLAPATLLSRDRAVLKLARRARDAGFAILTPEAWLRTRVSGAAPPG